MTRQIRIAWIIATCLSALPTWAYADSCAPPGGKRIYAAPSGQYGFNLTFRQGKPPEGVLFLLTNWSNKQTTVWRRPLTAPPAHVLVSDGGNVITLDLHCRAGWEHALVVYGEKGQPIADYRLEDLLTSEEIRDRTVSSVSSRNWLAGANFEFERNQSVNLFKISLPWGRQIAVDLATGKLRP